MTEGPNTVPAGHYRHFKGGRYWVIGTGYSAEDESEVVVYLNDRGILWTRPVWGPEGWLTPMADRVVNGKPYSGPRFWPEYPEE